MSTTGSLAGTLGLIQPFRYRGYVYDFETGFYYLQSRYYDPTTGRFISADVLLSTGQGVMGHNCYAYCLDNPVNMVDEGGEMPRICRSFIIQQLYEGDSANVETRVEVLLSKTVEFQGFSITITNEILEGQTRRPPADGQYLVIGTSSGDPFLGISNYYTDKDGIQVFSSAWYSDGILYNETGVGNTSITVGGGQSIDGMVDSFVFATTTYLDVGNGVADYTTIQTRIDVNQTRMACEKIGIKSLIVIPFVLIPGGSCNSASYRKNYSCSYVY